MMILKCEVNIDPMINIVRMLKYLLLIIPLALSLILFGSTHDQLGDLNDDGSVNVLDIVRIVNIILEVDPPPTDYELWSSDVNVDEFVDILDIIIIITVIMQTYDCPDLYTPCFDNLTLCCADTTSHDFIWEVDTLGWFHGNIYDAAIIAPDDVWIVGEITQDWTEYNAAHWNGIEWELVRITAPPYNVFVPFYSVFALAPNDIWVASHRPFHWDGEYWQEFFVADGYPPLPLSMHNIWGSSSSDLFFAGDSGTIVHYNGEEFVVQDTGTDYFITDIFGTSSENIWATSDYAYCFFGATELLFYDGISWNIYWEDNCLDPYPELYPGDLGNVWSDDHTLLVMGSLGLWRISFDTGDQSLDNGAFYGESGFIGWPRDFAANNPSDLFVVGLNGLLAHYNGIDWHQYDILYPTGVNLSSLNVVEIQGDFVIIGGYNEFDQPVVARGYRNSQ